MEQWQIARINFYTKSGVSDFIKDFFDVKRGFRCIVGHEKDMYKLKHEPTYRLWNNLQCRAYTLPDVIDHTYNTLRDYWCIHSYMYTFDKSVLEWNDAINSKSMFRDHRIGLNPIIELDTPDDPGSDKAKRLSFFDYIPEFNTAIEKIDKVLNEYTTEYNLQFSGNGIYILLEGYYGDDLLQEGCFRDNFINILDQLKENHDLDNKMKVHVCNSKAPWNKYFKIPFTFHETRPRISIPLPKSIPLDKEWIDVHSNFSISLPGNDNLYYLIPEAIKSAGWKKLW